jgi:copper oxidase (laccase) domain-containing protein
VCCYDIDSEREEAFRKEFPLAQNIFSKRNGKTYLDIGRANVSDMKSLGISSDRIDYDESLCTSSMETDFYSFRKSGKPLDGEMVGIIGFETS